MDLEEGSLSVNHAGAGARYSTVRLTKRAKPDQQFL